MIATCVARKRFLLFSNYIYTISFSYTGTVAASKQAVNAMASNSSCVFTGQADRKVKIWRVNLWSIYPATLCVLTTITIAYIPVAFIQCTYFHSPWCLSCSPHYWLIPVLCTDTHSSLVYLTLTLWVGGSVILMTLLFDGIVRVHSTYVYVRI